MCTAAQCLPQVNEVAAAVARRRSMVTFAPKDAQQIVGLLLHPTVAVLCCAVLCCAVLCCAVLYYAAASTCPVLLLQAAWEREDRLNQNSLESFLLSWRQVRQKQQDAEEEVVQSKQTSKQLRGKGRAGGGAGGGARGGASGVTDQGRRELGADKDIVTDMFPL